MMTSLCYLPNSTNSKIVLTSQGVIYKNGSINDSINVLLHPTRNHTTAVVMKTKLT